MPPQKIKSVFDCNIYLQAFVSGKGTAAKCKKMVDEGLVELYVSREILSKVRDVLTRPEIQSKFPHSTLEAADAFLEDIREKAVLFVPPENILSLSAIKKTNPILISPLKLKPNTLLVGTKICLI